MFEIRYLTFFTSGQGFAVEADLVRKIVRNMKITPVPTAPGEVIGIANIKRRVVTVLSIEALLYKHKRLDFENEQAYAMTDTVVFKPFSENDQMGLAIERPGKLIEIEENKILPPPETQGGEESRYISGIVNVEKIFYRIININSIVSRFEDRSLQGGTLDED